MQTFLINLSSRRGLISHPYAFAHPGARFQARRLGLIPLFALAFPAVAQEFFPEQVGFPITDVKPDIWIYYAERDYILFPERHVLLSFN